MKSCLLHEELFVHYLLTYECYNVLFVKNSDIRWIMKGAVEMGFFFVYLWKGYYLSEFIWKRCEETAKIDLVDQHNIVILHQVPKMLYQILSLILITQQMHLNKT